MQIDEIPERKDKSHYASSVLFEEFNDIDIYVEDSAHGYEKIFVELFSRVFEGRYKISKVFPLSGRDPVICKCRTSQGKFSRPSLYVVDGDLNLLGGGLNLKLDGLYQLPVYCMENILIDKDAIVEILDEEEVVRYRHEIEKDFDFDGWLGLNSTLLAELFTEYFVCHYFCPEQETISYPVNRLVSSDVGVLDPRKVNEKISELRCLVLERVDNSVYYAKRIEVKRKFMEDPLAVLRYSSAKDYLFPLLYTRSKSVVRMNVEKLRFKLRLAKKCELHHLSSCEGYIAGLRDV